MSNLAGSLLGNLSNRVGYLLVQLPIRCLMTQFRDVQRASANQMLTIVSEVALKAPVRCECSRS